MIIQPIKTKRIHPGEMSIRQLLEETLTPLPEQSILVITSKIVSLCEGSYVAKGNTDKNKLIQKEAEYILQQTKRIYSTEITIKYGAFISNAGIDESNGGQYYLTLPKNPQKIANTIRKDLSQKFKVKDIGVIITDSKSIPLRRGIVGTYIGYSGFLPLKDYTKEVDLFGRPFQVTAANLVEALAAAAVAVMGEGAEQTPLAIISDIPFVKFQNRNPSPKELHEVNITMEEDLFAPLYLNKNWSKRKG